MSSTRMCSFVFWLLSDKSVQTVVIVSEFVSDLSFTVFCMHACFYLCSWFTIIFIIISLVNRLLLLLPLLKYTSACYSCPLTRSRQTKVISGRHLLHNVWFPIKHLTRGYVLLFLFSLSTDLPVSFVGN